MKPLTKLKAKYIKSLQLKKNRNQEGCFIVEGEKSVLEFIRSDFKVKEVICTEEFIANLTPDEEMFEVYTCSASVLSGLGSFKSNNTALAVVEVKQDADFKIRNDTVILAIDQINDPGNLGTIIRIADWFGLETVLLSTNSVDVYNPKVVSASKGSLTRVNVRNVDLEEVFSDYKGNILAADLEGESLDNLGKIDKGIILMGSESHGISQVLSPYISKKITIPGKGGAESLNVAVATGIICNHLLG